MLIACSTSFGYNRSIQLLIFNYELCISCNSLRFYVPSHTWLLHVNISGCTIREKSSSIRLKDGRWCIQSTALNARALPHYSDELGVHNITEGYLFTERHPYTDSYYYILLYTEGETDATITITTKGNSIDYIYNIIRHTS